ncbi:MAG: iron-sulfur cluster assembly protein [Actinomycetota bacterium]
MIARAGTRPTTPDLMERLGGVMDPCSIGVGSPIDIVSMGLVERIDIDDDGATTVHLVLTQPSCWFFADLRQHVVDALAGVEGITGVRVEVFEELWTPDRMAPSYRLTLGRNRPARDEKQ